MTIMKFINKNNINMLITIIIEKKVKIIKLVIITL
jgi:hypothetical protein